VAVSPPRSGYLNVPWLPAGALLAIASICFAHLIMHPGALLVDGRKASIDHANAGDPRPIGNDLTFVFLPHHLAVGKVISAFGHIPMWDARGFGGRPAVGNPQAGLFYPPVWAVWWGPPSLLGWLTACHLLAAGIGVYVFLRSAAQGRWAATVGGSVYLASPFLLAHTFEGHYPHVWAAAWYPWAFWAFGQARRGRAAGLVALPIVLAMTFLAGHPQEWLLLVLALAAWSVADAVRLCRSHGARQAACQLVVSGGAAALSLGLAAIDLAPQLTVRPWLLRDHDASARVRIPRRYHLEALNGFQLLSPTALGGPADYFGSDNYWETLLSIGLVPLVLGFLAVRWHPDRKLVRAWLVLVGLALWNACGRHVLLYTAAYFVVPGMSLCRVPARSLFLANLGASVLAGLGAQTIAERLAEPRTWRRFAARCGVLIALVVAALYLIGPARRPGHFSRTAEAAHRVLDDARFQFALGGLAGLLVLGSLPLPSIRGPRLAGRLIGLLAVCELGWYGCSLLQVAPVEMFLGVDPVGAAIKRLEADSAPGGAVRIKARDNFYGDLRAASHEIQKTNVNDVFQIDHAAKLYELLYPVAAHRRRKHDDAMNEAVEDFNREVRQAVFDRMSVSHVVSDRFESEPGWPVTASGNWNGREFVIQSNPGQLPRAYVVPSALVAPRDERFDAGQLRLTDPRQSVLLDIDPLREITPDPRQPFTPAEWAADDPDHPVLRVTTEAPGLLVVADTWMPGWSAHVDGSPVPVLRGNHAQRVIPLLKPGRHTISLDYRPPGYFLGSAVTGVSALIWVLICGVAISDRLRRPRSPRRRSLVLPLSDGNERRAELSHQA
jgi:phage shock protein PspC (stress-responsive transcriptional regulator)